MIVAALLALLNGQQVPPPAYDRRPSYRSTGHEPPELNRLTVIGGLHAIAYLDRYHCDGEVNQVMMEVFNVSQEGRAGAFSRAYTTQLQVIGMMQDGSVLVDEPIKIEDLKPGEELAQCVSSAAARRGATHFTVAVVP